MKGLGHERPFHQYFGGCLEESLVQQLKPSAASPTHVGNSWMTHNVFFHFLSL